MSRIDDLITRLAPEGVEFARLGDVIRIRNGRDYKHLAAGDVPVYGTGGVMTRVDTAAHPGPSVLIPRKGSLSKLYYVESPFWTVDTIFYSEVGDRVEAKFVYYYLLTQRLEDLNKAGGVPSLTQGELNQLKVPVPPLEVQREVVRILDHFTELEAELEAELEERRVQYAHYRSSLCLRPQERAVPLGELLELKAGKFIAAAEILPERDESSPYPCFGGNGIRGFVPDWSHEGDRVLIGRQGALSGNVRRASGRFYATEHAVVATPREEIDTSWLFHALTAMNLNQYVSKGAQPGLAVSTVNNVTIEVPPLLEQTVIGEILDKFDALVNDLSVGLPAELTARRKQFEYYRDKLLTFEELV